MAQINKPDEYFNTVNYTGTGATQTISGVGHQPDFIWTKGKSAFYEHNLRDSVRGITKKIKSNDNSAEQTNTDGITATNSDGFILGADTAGAGANEVNQSGQNYVAWNWLAGGTASSNTDGSITSTVSANTTAGFSIVSYTGNGSAGATIGHGIGSTPSAIFVKKRNDLGDWSSYHSVLGNTGYMRLNSTNAFATASTYWNNTTPTSSVFTAGTTGNINGSGSTYIAYCFAEKKGFSKFGSYSGNSSTDGSFVYLGFKPAFLLIKNTSATQSWWMWDNKRIGYNGSGNHRFRPNGTDAEFADSTSKVDLLSNGFKWRDGDNAYNFSGNNFIYMAFAENPLVGTNNIPAVAR